MSVQGQLGAVEGADGDLADQARPGVEDEEQDRDQHRQQLQDAPVPAPDEEDGGPQRVHKPVEGGFGAAAGKQVVSE